MFLIKRKGVVGIPEKNSRLFEKKPNREVDDILFRNHSTLVLIAGFNPG